MHILLQTFPARPYGNWSPPGKLSQRQEFRVPGPAEVVKVVNEFLRFAFVPGVHEQEEEGPAGGGGDHEGRLRGPPPAAPGRSAPCGGKGEWLGMAALGSRVPLAVTIGFEGCICILSTFVCSSLRFSAEGVSSDRGHPPPPRPCGTAPSSPPSSSIPHILPHPPSTHQGKANHSPGCPPTVFLPLGGWLPSLSGSLSQISSGMGGDAPRIRPVPPPHGLRPRVGAEGGTAAESAPPAVGVPAGPPGGGGPPPPPFRTCICWEVGNLTLTLNFCNKSIMLSFNYEREFKVVEHSRGCQHPMF